VFWLSGASLLIVMAGCLAGVFLPARYYDDNLFQRVGMSGLFMFSLARFDQLVRLGELTGNCVPVSTQLCGHVGLAMLVLGTAWKARADYVTRGGISGSLRRC